MTAPVRPTRQRLTPEQYKRVQAEGVSDDELRAEGYDPPEAEGIGGKVASAAAGAFEGATFGLGDEAVGALGSVLPGRTYEGTRDKIREWLKERKAANPKTYTAANVAGAVVSPASKVLMAGKAATLGGAVAKGARMGATGGALYGFGAAEGDAGDQLGSTVAGGLIGGVAGGVVPLLGAAAKSVGSNARDIAQRVRGRITGTAGQTGQVITAQGGSQPVSDWSLQAYAKAVRKGGVTPEQLEQAAASATPDDPRLLLNVSGRKAVAKTDAALRVADDAGSALTDALEGQTGGSANRVIQGIDRASPRGQVNVVDRLAEITKRQREAAGPLYKQVDEFGPVVDDEVSALLQRPGGRDALKRAETIAANEGSPLAMLADDSGALTKAPTLRDLDRVKQSLDAIIEKERTSPPSITKAELNALRELRGQLVKRLDDLTTGEDGSSFYREARGAFAGEARLRDALEEGREAWAKSTNPDQLAASIKGLSASEREAFLEGALQSMRDVVGNATEEIPNFWRKLQGSDAQKKKLLEVFASAPDKAEELQALLQGERAMAKDAAQLMRGSQTAQRLQEAHEFTVPTSRAGIMAALARRGQFLTEGRAGDFTRIAADRLSDPRVQAVIREMRRQQASTTALSRAGGRAGAGTTAVTRP